MNHFIRRTLAGRLELEDTSRATVIYGARQTGKTTLVESIIAGRSYEWFTGDRASHIERLSAESAPEMLLAKDVLFIDEAQRIPGIGLIVKRLVDKHSACKIFVTGSSAFELAGRLTDSAAGRLESFRLWPLSLRELKEDTSSNTLLDSLPARLLYGSYPVVINEPQSAQRHLMELLDAVLFKDVFEISGIRRPTKLLNLVKLLALNVGSEVSYEGLARRLAMTVPAVIRYVDLLEQNFIVFRVSSFARNVATELRKGKKIYFCDNGIRNAVLEDFRALEVRDDVGALWENLFALERRKLHEYAEDGVKLYFWRTAQQQEVDFIEEDNGSLRAFECKVSQGHARLPKTFSKAYPQCSFHVVTPETCLQWI